jgi:colanic acid biosynthesis protein WcaH
MLTAENFLKTIDATPLVAIDLIVPNDDGAVLLGYRVNKPAQGYWFVPGGRIHKNERLGEAFRRITSDELGRDDLRITDAELIGVYEHLYEDNFFGEPGVSTHYVVLAYRLREAPELDALPKTQHTSYRWASAQNILRDHTVHANTRAYFDTASCYLNPSMSRVGAERPLGGRRNYQVCKRPNCPCMAISRDY